MSSLTDAVCLALTAKWQAALTGVSVADGPQVNSDPAPDWLFVGSDAADTGNLAAFGEQSLMAFTRVKKDNGQVTCAVVSVRGDDNITAARASANATLSAAEDALRADMTLGGLVMQAYVSTYQYTPSQTTAGAHVRIVFTVTYLAQL